LAIFENQNRSSAFESQALHARNELRPGENPTKSSHPQHAS
jgi:hypothetical protein